jgi:hypothetical protein
MALPYTDAPMPLYTIIVLKQDDNTMTLLKRLGASYQQRIMLIVPEAATHVFRGVDDFRALRRVTRERSTTVMLVLCGRERLRIWARRLGFQVYASPRVALRVLERKQSRRFSVVLPQRAMSPLPPSAVARRRGAGDAHLALWLTVLLVLGILGGVVFGYLLSVISLSKIL